MIELKHFKPIASQTKYQNFSLATEPVLYPNCATNS